MMRARTCTGPLIGLFALLVACGPPPPHDTRMVVETLASDDYEGRLTGSTGEQMAAHYLIGQLQSVGADPLPGHDAYRHEFTFTAGIEDTGTIIALSDADGAPVELPAAPSGGEAPSVRGLAFSETAAVEAPLVFAGYGLSVPETADGFSYDSYATLDVEGKIAVVLRYFPEESEGDVRGELSRVAGLRNKAFVARERGAVGLIVVTGPTSPNAGEPRAAHL